MRDHMFNPNKLKLFIALFCLAILSGCAAKQIDPIPYSHQTLAADNQRIGIISSALPETDMTYPGADCLLCMGAASAMNSSLSSHAETIDASELYQVKNDIAEVLTKQGKAVVVLDQHIDIDSLEDHSSKLPNVSDKSFRSFANNDNLTHLLVLDFDYIGFQRKYAAYIPTSDPFARVNARAFLVDTNTNEYQWYLPLNITQAANGEWDEPDNNFPGLTNALYQALAKTRESMQSPLAQQTVEEPSKLVTE